MYSTTNAQQMSRKAHKSNLVIEVDTELQIEIPKERQATHIVSLPNAHMDSVV